MPNGNSDRERITALEVQFRDIMSDLHEIKTNHLAHLDSGLVRVQWLLVAFMLLYLFGPEALEKIKLLV